MAPRSVLLNPLKENRSVVISGSEGTQREADTLAALYEKYYARVARYCYTRVGDRDLAEDMASDVFLRAVESLGRIEQRDGPPQAWLFRVAHNLVIDHYRKSARRQSVPIDGVMVLPASSNTAAEVEQSLTMETVYAAMESLHPAQQEVVSLRFMGGLSSEETGGIMGRTNGAVRELQRTAIKALRGLLDGGIVGEEAGLSAGVDLRC
jgi:RNA polymerase sigma-70 factor (ECF subfamily)